MRTLTQEEQEQVDNKNLYIEQKVNFLAQYKKHKDELEFADDDFEEGIIEEKRAKLAFKIKDLNSKLKEIESLENLA
jgi:hypothetical protein